MDIEEAFATLGIDPSSKAEEINRRFKELSLEHHPDRGGDNNYMARLVEARDIAITVSQAFGLVPANTVKEIVASSLSTIIEKRDAKEESEKAFNRVLRITTSRLSENKRKVATLGFVSAGITIFTTQVFPLLKATFPLIENASGPVSLIFGGIAALFAVQYLIADNQVKRLEGLFQELDEHLSEQSFFLELIQKLIPPSYIAEKWTRQELEQFIEAWMEDTKWQDNRLLYREGKPIYAVVKKIGVNEFARLISAKGKSLGVINESREVKNGFQEVRMQIISPS